MLPSVRGLSPELVFDTIFLSTTVTLTTRDLSPSLFLICSLYLSRICFLVLLGVLDKMLDSLWKTGEEHDDSVLLGFCTLLHLYPWAELGGAGVGWCSMLSESLFGAGTFGLLDIWVEFWSVNEAHVYLGASLDRMLAVPADFWWLRVLNSGLSKFVSWSLNLSFIGVFCVSTWLGTMFTFWSCVRRKRTLLELADDSLLYKSQPPVGKVSTDDNRSSGVLSPSGVTLSGLGKLSITAVFNIPFLGDFILCSRSLWRQSL